MKIFRIAIILLIFTFFSKNLLAWSGYDNDNNTTIEIGKGEMVREGLTITIFDWSTDEYHDVDVIVMEESFNGIRMEVYDTQTKKTRFFEMED
jgi:pyruvate/2-oxoglutarate/acetoin dehydrogenase E1 component